MHGAGFTHQMVSVTRSNRLLLKGSKNSVYQNFDKSYITDYVTSRKKISWKKASPEYLRQLRTKLIDENKKIRTGKGVVFLLALILVSTLFLWIFLS